MKYKVSFVSWAYVEADSLEEAVEAAQEGNTVYEEAEVSLVEEVDEFLVDW